MKHLLTILIMLLAWAGPALAAVTSSTPLLTIQKGQAVRVTAGVVLNSVLSEGLTIPVTSTKDFTTTGDVAADDVTATGDITAGGSITATGGILSALGAGAAAGINVTATENGNGAIHKTTLVLAATPMNIRDTEQGGGLKIYDFPEGRIAIVGATGSVTFTTTSVVADTLNASVSARWGVGTSTQANATLEATEQNILPVTTFTTSAEINVAGSEVGAGFGMNQFDGTTAAADAFLNMSVPAATDIDADASVTVDGSITITWINLGDY